MMEWFTWITQSRWIQALPFAVILGSVFSLIGPWLKNIVFGSRHSDKNWNRGRVEKGGKQMKLGTKLSKQDTAYSEGDSRAVYYMVLTGYVYKTAGHIRYCFLRSYVAVVWAYNQWETDKKVGTNLMDHMVKTFKGMGLKQCTDDKGNSYWETIPVADVLVPELCIELPKVLPVKPADTRVSEMTVVMPPVPHEKVVLFADMQLPASTTAALLAQVAQL